METRQPIVQVESEQCTVHSPHQSQLEGKNPPSRDALSSMTQLFIGCMEILFLKLASTRFGLDYIALPKNTLPIRRTIEGGFLD
jgi:hypothetical protein